MSLHQSNKQFRKVFNLERYYFLAERNDSVIRKTPVNLVAFNLMDRF